MKNVKNQNEIDKIKDLINMNRFCLKDTLLDGIKKTDNRINNLDIDKIEDIVENQIQLINIWKLQKEKRFYNRTDYLVKADIYLTNGDIYEVSNWFGYIKNKEIFEDSVILTYMYEENLL